MPFSHHSHSGQFCGHAVDTLEQCVQKAISLKMSTFCMTEHIARKEIDFYPEEEKVHTMASLEQLYDDFYHEARRLQKKYADQIQLLIGFEGEWIREYSLDIIHGLLKKYEVDLFVGSVHHVHTIPIDYDTPYYYKARDAAGGTDERIFEDYFDSQYEMLQALKPPLIGHFDLIRLKSDDPNASFKAWPAVWKKIVRNLKFIAAYGGILELNSSALRKGMTEAYPQAEICREFKNMGGRFTFSCDSHGTEQVGLNFESTLENNVLRAGISELYYLAPTSDKSSIHDSRFPNVSWAKIPTAEYDSTYGIISNSTIEVDCNRSLSFNGNNMRFYMERDPASIPWAESGADYIIEWTIVFTTTEKASAHFEGGTTKIVISAPSADTQDAVRAHL